MIQVVSQVSSTRPAGLTALCYVHLAPHSPVTDSIIHFFLSKFKPVTSLYVRGLLEVLRSRQKKFPDKLCELNICVAAEPLAYVGKFFF